MSSSDDDIQIIETSKAKPVKKAAAPKKASAAASSSKPASSSKSTSSKPEKTEAQKKACVFLLYRARLPACGRLSLAAAFRESRGLTRLILWTTRS